MGNVKIMLNFNVSDETIDDMLGTASMEVGYWVSEFDLPVDGRVRVVESEGDDGEPVVHHTDYLTLREAFKKLADPDTFSVYIGQWVHEYFQAAITDRDENTGEIDAGHIDAHAADAWLQVAVFGSVKYG